MTMAWVEREAQCGAAEMAFEADGPLRGDARQCVASFRGGITSRHRALRTEKAMEHTDVWSFEAQTIGVSVSSSAATGARCC